MLTLSLFEIDKLNYVCAAGILRRAFRALWDAFMFHAVIKKRGRIPGSDGFTVKRIAGPGLASNFYYQVKFII